MSESLCLGTVSYPFDPEDAWDPDFTRCVLCEQYVRPGVSVVDAGGYDVAHADCARAALPNVPLRFLCNCDG